jgi:hypothetical protein
MNTGWVKLWRKAKNNEIVQDPIAFAIFCYLLMEVDRETGSCYTSYRKIARAMRLDAMTFRRKILWLEEVLHILIHKSNTYGTTIQIVNWDKYQNTKEEMIHKTIHKTNTSVTPYIYNKKNKEDKEERESFKNDDQLGTNPKGRELLKEFLVKKGLYERA